MVWGAPFLPQIFPEPLPKNNKNLTCKVRPGTSVKTAKMPKSRGGTNGVFGKPCFCPLPKRGRFDENGENDEFAFYPLKTRASLLRPLKTTKMTKMAGVTQEKAWFSKSRVCTFVLPGKKCLRRVLKVIRGLRAEGPKRVFRTECGALIQEARKHLFFALSLSIFGHIGCCDTCPRLAGSQNLEVFSCKLSAGPRCTIKTYHKTQKNAPSKRTFSLPLFRGPLRNHPSKQLPPPQPTPDLMKSEIRGPLKRGQKSTF